MDDDAVDLPTPSSSPSQSPYKLQSIDSSIDTTPSTALMMDNASDAEGPPVSNVDTNVVDTSSEKAGSSEVPADDVDDSPMDTNDDNKDGADDDVITKNGDAVVALTDNGTDVGDDGDNRDDEEVVECGDESKDKEADEIEEPAKGEVEAVEMDTEEPSSVADVAANDVISEVEPPQVANEDEKVLDEDVREKDEQEEEQPLELSKEVASSEEPIELKVSKVVDEEEMEAPLELSTKVSTPTGIDEPLQLTTSDEPLELTTTKTEDEPLELKVSKESVADEPLELSVKSTNPKLDDELMEEDVQPLELKVAPTIQETLQEEPLELSVKTPPESKPTNLVVNGHKDTLVLNGGLNGHVNGTVGNDDDEEMDVMDEEPPLKELSAEELQEKEKKIRNLRYQLEQEELKLVLLKKIRLSQTLKENNVQANDKDIIPGPGAPVSRTDASHRQSSAPDGHHRSGHRDSSSHDRRDGHHLPSSSITGVHGIVQPGHVLSSHLPPPTVPGQGRHHNSMSSSSGLPPPSRHSMVMPGSASINTHLQPAHSGHRLDSSSGHERHRVRDHGSQRTSSSDISRSRSGVYNPPIPQIHAHSRTSGSASSSASHILGLGPPNVSLPPAHSGHQHHSSRGSGTIPGAVPAPAHGGHSRSSSSRHNPITTPPNVVIGSNYTPSMTQSASSSREVSKEVLRERSPVIESPAQKLEKAKKMIRANLEKTLLNLPLPKPPIQEMHFVPNFNQLEFQYYMGLETVVDLLTNSPNIGKPPPDPFECFQCGTDFTPVWKWQEILDPKMAARPAVICESCVNRNVKKAIRTDHTSKIRAAIAESRREERDVEAKIAAGTYSPPSRASPALNSHSSASSTPNLPSNVSNVSLPPPPQPSLPAHMSSPMAAPSPPSFAINSNVAHRNSSSSANHHSSSSSRRSAGHERSSPHVRDAHRSDPMSAHLSISGHERGHHHGHQRSSTGSMAAPPAAHSSAGAHHSSAGQFSSSSTPRMSGDELGRRRERSPQVRDTGNSASNSAGQAALAAQAAAAAAAAQQAAAVNQAAAQIFAQMQKMTPQQQQMFLSQSLGGLGGALGPMANMQAMPLLAPLLLGQFGLGLGGAPGGGGSGSGSKGGQSSSNSLSQQEQLQQRMFLEMMANPAIAGLGLPPQGSSGNERGSSRHSREHSSGYRNH